MRARVASGPRLHDTRLPVCAQYYTHFTSPIRRYADVMVHRLLAEACASGGAPVPARATLLEATARQCRVCNERKAGAKAAQDRSDVVFLCRMLARAPLEVAAVVLDTGGKSFDLLVPSLGLEARVFYDRLGAASREEDIPAGGEVVLTPVAGGAAPASATFRPLDRVTVVLHADTSRVPVEVKVSVPALRAWAEAAAAAAAAAGAGEEGADEGEEAVDDVAA